MNQVIFHELPIQTSKDPRKIRVLLPKDYHTTEKNYSVLYMHDGQNLFDDATSYGGHSWGIPKTLNDLHIEDVIVVGIDNSDLRLFEYAPWKSSELVKEIFNIELGGLGDVYADFVAKQVKPFVDQTYRTLSDTKHTWVAGSSMGAYISVYIAVKYPHLFGGVGCFSLASWFNEEDFLNFIKNAQISKSQRYFISIGDNETSDEKKKDFNLRYLENSRSLKSLLEKLGVLDVYYIETHDVHNELAWRKMFNPFIKWMTSKA
jgi:predicted alpha/beta superfamily hydrolase